MEPNRISRRLKLNDLRILMTVVQAGSMNKAADILNSTQAAVSRSIKDLERAVGVPLLDRNPRGIAPTAYGKALLDGGAAMFDDLLQALQNIEFLNNPAVGNIRIGCSPLLAATFISAVIDRVSAHYPLITFQIESAPVELVHRQLCERSLDILITRKVGPIADERLAFDFLFDDSFVVVCGKSHAMAKRRKITLAHLAAESWVLPPRSTVLGAAIFEGFQARGLDYPKTAVETVSPEARMSLLSSGRFLTIFPESALRYSTTHVQFAILPVQLPLPRVPIGVVTLNNRVLSPAVRLFIDQAREVARPLTQPKALKA